MRSREAGFFEHRQVATLGDNDQRAVLEASIALWRSDQHGVSDPESWFDSAEFMLATGLIESPVDVETLYTNQFVGE